MMYYPPPSSDDKEKQKLVSRALARTRCAVCGRPFEGQDCNVVDRQPDAWVVSVTCPRCRTMGYVVVVMAPPSDAAPARPTEQSPEEQDEQDEARRGPPITSDDVLDIHLMLQDYEGDVYRLFDEVE